MNRKILAACTVALVSVGLVLSTATIALAEDAPPADPAVVSEVTAPEEAVVAPEEPAPVVVEATTEEAFVALGFTPPSQVTEWHSWQFKPGVTPTLGHSNAQEAWFPQTYVGAGQLVPPCGVYYQQDKYKGSAKKLADLIALPGGLTWANGHAVDNDYVSVIDWNIVYGGDCVTNVLCETFANGGTATNLDANGWVENDTRSKGHAEYVENGLHIYSDAAAGESPDQRKLQWAKDVTDFPLSQVGQFAADYDNTSGLNPGVKVVVEFAPGLYGTLVWESVYDVAGEQDLWLPESSDPLITAPDNGGGYGSTRHGTVNEWLSVYPNATVVGGQFGAGSGADFDGVLHSVTFGCTTYSFDYQDIPVELSFNVQPPVAQCGIAGILPDLGDIPAGVTRAVTGPASGPGHYTITFSALAGFKIVGQAVFDLIVPDALLFQSDNPEAPCYVEPRDDVVTEEAGQPLCGDTSFITTTSTVKYTLNPLTGDLVAGEPILGSYSTPVTPTACEGLAFTGTDLQEKLNILLWAGLIVALGTLVLIWARRKHSA